METYVFFLKNSLYKTREKLINHSFGKKKEQEREREHILLSVYYMPDKVLGTSNILFY